MNGRFLFGKTKRKWGFNLVPHSGTSHGKAVLLCAENVHSPGTPAVFAPIWRIIKTLLVEYSNPWYDNVKKFKGCLP